MAPGASVARMLRGVVHYLADAVMLQLMSGAPCAALGGGEAEARRGCCADGVVRHLAYPPCCSSLSLPLPD